MNCADGRGPPSQRHAGHRALRAQAQEEGAHSSAANAAEADVVEGLAVYPVKHLREAAEFLAGAALIRPVSIDPSTILGEFDAIEHDFADVKGEQHVKRAIEVAVNCLSF